MKLQSITKKQAKEYVEKDVAEMRLTVKKYEEISKPMQFETTHLQYRTVVAILSDGSRCTFRAFSDGVATRT